MLKQVVLTVLSATVVCSLAVATTSCKDNPDPKTPATSCDGQSRPMLDCTSEFKYDDRLFKGGFNAFGVGASLETETKALREVDKETAQYVAQSRRLCEEYNKCIIDKDAYATRAENLRRRIAKVPELLDSLTAAKGSSDRAKAVSMAYQALVPDEQRVELGMDFSVMAQRPSDPAPIAIRPGTSLPTGARVSFTIRTTRAAHVYLFQKSPDGAINVLFPDPRMNLSNPMPAGQALRIPPGEGAFKLNDKDIGEEKVFLTASLQPIPSMQAATGQLAAGQGKVAVLESLAAIPGNSPSATCNTRALEFDAGSSPGCVRSRGLELDTAGPSTSPSLSMRTEAGDSTIVGVFSFQHTR